MLSSFAAAQPARRSAKSVAAETKPQQRNDPRVPHRVPCRVRLVDPSTGEIRTVVGETVNLSAGGVAIHVSLAVPVGTWVETLVPHASGDPLFLCGTVMHCRRTLAANYELGISVARDAPSALS